MKKTKIKELAEEFGVHRNTIRNWISYYFDLGNELDLYDKESVEKFKEYGKQRLAELGRTYE